MPISSLWNKYKIIVLQCRNTVCQCITRPVTVTQQMPSSSFAIHARGHCAGLPSAACEEEPCLCLGRRQATRLLFLNNHDSLVCSACYCRKSRAILLCNISRCRHCARLYIFLTYIQVCRGCCLEDVVFQAICFPWILSSVRAIPKVQHGDDNTVR